MTAEAFAELLHARRIGANRWQARCPVHDDRSPSLSIREGLDGRVLVHCFAGCPYTEILAKLGLCCRDLFPGPAPSSAKKRKLTDDRSRRDTETRAQRQVERSAYDRVRKLTFIVDALGERLAHMPDDTSAADMLARLFHHSIARLREAEMALEVKR